MPIGGKLVLKGGEPLLEKKIKKKKKKDPNTELEIDAEEGGAAVKLLTVKPQAVDAPGVSLQSGHPDRSKTYEDEFEFEKQRRKDATVKSMVKNTPWGSSYRAPPEILHGYTKKVLGKTAEERLDMRAAAKTTMQGAWLEIKPQLFNKNLDNRTIIFLHLDVK